MSRFRATLSYALVQAFLWGIFAVLLSFASNFLLANGMNNAGVSLVLGVSTAISIAGQLILGETVAKKQKLKIWCILLLTSALMLVGCGAMLVHKISLIAIGGYALVCILLQILPALGNAIGMDSIENGSPINFGVARGCGSLAYSLISYFAGLVILDNDAYHVEILGAAVVVLFAVSVVLFHFWGERSQPTAEKQDRKKPEGSFLKQHKRFAVFLVGCTLLLFNHNLICNFMLQIMQQKGGADAHVAQGTANAIGAVLEIPAMVTFVWLLKLARCDRWLKLSCIFFALKGLLIFLAPSAYWVYAAQTLQIAGFALFSISSVYYAGKVAGEGDAVRAQTYLASTTTIGSLLALSTGGLLCQYLGADKMLLIAAIMAFSGMVIVLFSAEKIPQTDKEKAF